MTPLPPPLGSGEIRFWRLDQERHTASWASGEGAWLMGGRWNPKGVPAVYAALDPATAILEVAVHKGFKVLDTATHVLTSARILDAPLIHVVHPEDVPNPNWLVPSSLGPGQQAFGGALLQEHRFVLIPSTVSRHSWNLIFDPAKAAGSYDDVRQERFALDPRLHRA
ncbi:MAG TPA: RES domain-containing protein [Tabrizicola sp.]|nr:RES domain-containing protein [Tabrizicola sp.]